MSHNPFNNISGVRVYGNVTAAKINEAINTVSAAGGGVVTVAKGAMTVTGVGTDRIYTKKNVRLVFEPGCTIATGAYTGASNVMVIASTGSVDMENVIVEGNGLVITMNQEDEDSTGFGIVVDSSGGTFNNVRISDIILKDARYDGFYMGGNLGAFVQGVIVERVTSTNSMRTGCSLTGQVRHVKFIDCHFDDNGNGERPACGVDIENNPKLFENDITFVRCSFNRNEEQGLFAQNPDSSVTARVTVIDCEAIGNDDAGFAINTPGSIVRGCRAYQNANEGFSAVGDVQFSDCISERNGGTGFAFVTFQNHLQGTSLVARWNGGSGFALSGLTDYNGMSTGVIGLQNCQSYGNMLRGYEMSSCQNSTIEGCRAIANGQDGLKLAQNARYNRISGGLYAGNGLVSDNTTDNIIMESSASLNTIDGVTSLQSTNFFHGTASATLSTGTALEIPSAVGISEYYKGMYVRIISGTQSGKAGVITAYNSTTFVATVSWVGGALSPAPDGTSIVEIVGTRLFAGPIDAATSTTVTFPEGTVSETDDFYNGMIFNVADNTGAGQYGYVITDYDGATRTITLGTALTTALVTYHEAEFEMTVQSLCEIVAINRPRYAVRVNAGCVGNRVINNDLYYGGANSTFSDGGTGTVTTSGNRLS